MKIEESPRPNSMKKTYSDIFLKCLILLVLLASLLSGCATLALSALGAGAGVGIPYVVTDCADRTLNFSFEQVTQLTPQVLQKMDIAVIDNNQTENGKRIRASATNLDITIDMERVTTRATRVTINAKKGGFIKDKATAEEIINQLERMLARK